jgi:cytochrome c oxidase subunit 4
MITGPEVDPRRARALPFVLGWAGLLLLAGLSTWTALLGMGLWAPVVQFGIAGMQTVVLFVLFMRLKGPPSLKWVFAGAGFFWLLFLYGLSMTDYADRRGWPPIYNPGPGLEARDPAP